MHNNTLYNLMIQLTQEQKSLWRIEKMYADEAASDAVKAFWEKLAEDKRGHIAELTALVKENI